MDVTSTVNLQSMRVDLVGSLLRPHSVKVTSTGPDVIQQVYDSAASLAVYPSTNEFLRDVVAVERQRIEQPAQAGCRYIVIDGPGYTAYVDHDALAAMRSRGEDPYAI